jgi:para-nitrobenzyl esterase
MAEHLVETTSGPVVGETKYGVQRWKGIPFAAPPIGDLRFAPPQPVEAWTERRDATGKFS